MMNIEIIKAPVITEKTNNLSSNNVYVFKVDKKANKTEIKQVIENKWNVKVESVNTTNTKAKRRRVGKYTGYTTPYKKAYVKLKEGSTIEF
ncbi:MAG: 50S ribosomal protein L23 [Tenericutes bacterium]|nr:50S ribosomal protein L23 [Mycoplasmatota bacterium]